MQSLSVGSASTSSESDSSKTVTSLFETKGLEESDFDRGFVEQKDALTLNVWSNTAWVVTVQAESRYLADESNYKKSVEDLTIRSSEEEVQASTTSKPIASGNAGESEINIDYELNLTDEDQEHYQSEDLDYKVRLNYTITTD